MTTFGITGSIACGKSTVTKFIRKAGVPIVDADVIAREVVVPGSPGLQAIVDAFGKEFLTESGELDRAKLGKLVFNGSSVQLAKLNIIMHSLIHAESTRQILNYHNEGFNLVGYDAALIIENGHANKYKPLLVVSAPFETQLSRLMARNGLTEEEARARIGAQLSSEEKAKHADFVVHTTGTLEELETNVLNVVKEIRAYVKGYQFGVSNIQL